MITNINIDALILDENNPRTIDKEAMTKLCDSLKKDPDFMLKRPVLVNNKQESLYVYAGNQRVRAAKMLGWKMVPCIIDNDLNDQVMKDRVVKDNQHFGQWDWDILANNYEIDALIEVGFEEKDLIPHFDEIDVLDEKKSPKKKKSQMCPNCAFEF